ncbi:hypothetical protein PPYR_06185 [Photinus pyralis]|uniref:BTB domain-containing protein n=1 Tax=Photinus pyralis TaxID=7054 RepID=A0A5N4ASV0_PHOPY|nr:uncharacterized protein LOC116167121 [Photinus pyralis]KAB0800445.1 hypothetical protein PPYR_06185 [Photinus pyralis]
MNKEESDESQYYVKWETHGRFVTSVLCSLLEHQSLVDVVICCGTNTIHVHKCVLAANSQYFREQLERNMGTEQIIMTGIDFVIVRSLIEYMYCGITNISHKNLKYMIAAANFFQIRGIQVLVSDQPEIGYEAGLINIPPPVFLTKKPKYANSCRALNTPSPPENYNMFKMPNGNDSYVQKKYKRKFVRSEAEKACAKEAAASRLALEALQREIASTPQVGSFVIEESCTETTVENFIPHTDETYSEHLDHDKNVPELQVMNFQDLSNSTFVNTQMIDMEKTQAVGSIMQFDMSTDKLQHMLGAEVPTNLEIMFRTSEGQLVNITEEQFHNLSDGTLQYQFVDEDGQLSEVRQLQVPEQQPTLPSYQTTEQHPFLEPSNFSEGCEKNEPNPQGTIPSDMSLECKEDASDSFLETLRPYSSENVGKVKASDVDLEDIVDITDIIDETGLNTLTKGDPLQESSNRQDASLLGGGDCEIIEEELSPVKMSGPRRMATSRKKRLQ